MNDPDLSILEKLYHSGAWLCIAILAAFWGLRYASNHIAWLKEDHRAAIVAALLGGAATFIVPVTQGTTPSIGMLVAALGTAWALFTQPKPSLMPPKAQQAGFVRLGLVVFVAIFGVIVIGCAWFKSESKAVAGDVVDCTKTTAAGAIKEFGPAIDALLVYATGGNGTINSDAIKDAGRGFAKEVGGCVVADAIARALKPPAADPNAPKASPLEAAPDSLRATLAELYPGQHFKTANGVL